MFPSHVPDELILHIFSYLSLPDQLQFSQTCRTISAISHERTFWRPRIKALAPQSQLEPTKLCFLQVFKRALKETAFFSKNHAKICTILSMQPDRMADVTTKLHTLEQLCLNPWGEHCVENLTLIHRFLDDINVHIIEAQIPTNSFALRFESITRLPAACIERHRTLFATLQKCELQDNLLETLPDNIDILQTCNSLNLYNNPMKTLPACFKDLQNVNFLYFSDGHMPTFPTAIYELVNLQWLSFSNMGLINLPAGIGKLKNLNWLYLRDNNLNILPEDFYKLTKIRELFLEHNPLSILQFHQVLKLLSNVKCDVHNLFKTQFRMLNTVNRAEPSDVDDLIDRFNLLSTTPAITPARASLQRHTLASSGPEFEIRSRMESNGIK